MKCIGLIWDGFDGKRIGGSVIWNSCFKNSVLGIQKNSVYIQKNSGYHIRKFWIYPEKIWIYPEFFDPKILDIISENSGYIHFCFLTRISDMSQNSGYIQNSGDNLFAG